jgi:hypothetical protein
MFRRNRWISAVPEYFLDLESPVSGLRKTCEWLGQPMGLIRIKGWRWSDRSVRPTPRSPPFPKVGPGFNINGIVVRGAAAVGSPKTATPAAAAVRTGKKTGPAAASGVGSRRTHKK